MLGNGKHTNDVYLRLIGRWIMYLVIPVWIFGCTENRPASPLPKNVKSSTERIKHNREPDGTIHLDNFTDVENLLVLQSKPKVMEPELRTGRWLLLVYSVLSVQDVNSAKRCTELAPKLRGEVRVAMRPITTFEEAEKWLPDYQNIHGDAGSPWWIVMDSGRAIRWKNGWVSNEEVLELLRK